jgi:hypothetical protein
MAVITLSTATRKTFSGLSSTTGRSLKIYYSQTIPAFISIVEGNDFMYITIS